MDKGMLVVSRKKGERVFIFHPDGTQYEVTIVEVNGNKVRVGLLAPRDHVILREELVAKNNPS